MQLTLQLYLSGQWHDAMRLDVETPEAGQSSPCSFAYEQAFLIDHLEAAERLRALPDLLSERGLPQKTFNHPRIALARLDATLKGWGLL